MKIVNSDRKLVGTFQFGRSSRNEEKNAASDISKVSYLEEGTLFRQKRRLAILTATRSTQKWTSVSKTLLNLKLLPSINVTITVEEALAWELYLYIGIDSDDLFWKEALNLDRYNLQLSNIPPFLQIRPLFFSKSPGSENKIPFNDVAKIAFDDGAEYFVRINDDTEFRTPSWITKGTNALKSFEPSNVGVVGPFCPDGNTAILTHDMVHRTHLQIFNGSYYPEAFSNWWLDDWITQVYSKKNLGETW
eukprot:CAMPEP_0197727586 /NCGR_PEP_ID=MMETSP1434-20131217/21550_1 /TAXON_ID=265543 /ORGANISM="Minutocellus polymorphus, Strain CCMP3303" /LENGTH=247 /DNA_ID=CAMNT_0043313829 /DNA_START=88 /DNA_END=828 /DNA_ORIENTATION=+